uniref:Uncharacterized protein n=1 Tax=Panagrolaimus sp. ES5 TaxID=591445 RepID=A0AC34G2P8_9BILA
MASINNLQLASNKKFPTYDEYRASCGHQNFAFRESIMNYMAKKSDKSLRQYNKLIRSCKYFFVKDPILILHCLHFDGEEWIRCIKESCLDLKTETVKIDLKKIRSKINVTVVSKLCTGNVDRLELENQRLSFKDLLLFSKNVGFLTLDKCSVFEENGNEVAFERIVSSFQYREMLQRIVDEILEGPRFYLAPFFEFNGQLKRRKLLKLWNKDFDSELDARKAAFS